MNRQRCKNTYLFKKKYVYTTLAKVAIQVVQFYNFLTRREWALYCTI